MYSNGFYRTSITGPFGSSHGIIHHLDGVITGGDDYMIYKGRFEGEQRAVVKALVYRQNDVNSGKSFELTAKVSSAPNGLTATGKYPDGSAFSLSANFICGPDL